MSKFSVFTLFLSATIVVIVAELMVNEYVKYPAVRKDAAASVLQIENAPAAEPAAQDATQQQAVSAITYSTLTKSGFKDFSLQRVPFKGILFDSMDLGDFKSVPVEENNLLENNRRQVATFYEFRAGSRMLSGEVYSMLKEKCGKLIGASTNMTNSFGVGSFYVNFVERPASAFLVVNMGDNVYALTYLKELHPLVKNLLAEITLGASTSNK
jgi:hypothetical protein